MSHSANNSATPAYADFSSYMNSYNKAAPTPITPVYTNLNNPNAFVPPPVVAQVPVVVAPVAPAPVVKSNPFIDEVMSLISKVQCRYVGVLLAIDEKAGTLTLGNVRVYGTEDRVREGEGTTYLATPDVYDTLVFYRGDIAAMTCIKDADVVKAHKHVDQNIEKPDDISVLTDGKYDVEAGNSKFTELTAEELPQEDITSAYDKKSSFFDSLGGDLSSNSKTRTNNFETFGADAGRGRGGRRNFNNNNYNNNNNNNNNTNNNGTNNYNNNNRSYNNGNSNYNNNNNNGNSNYNNNNGNNSRGGYGNNNRGGNSYSRGGSSNNRGGNTNGRGGRGGYTPLFTNKFD